MSDTLEKPPTTVRNLRWYQGPLMQAMLDGKKRAIAIWHRRAGKDEMALFWTAEAIKQRPANYWHCLPEYAQARKAIWDAVNPRTGKKRIDEAFPLHWRASTVNNEMKIVFVNGAVWQVIGSDSYDGLVGAGVAGVVFSEWALANPSAWGYIRPMVVENDGWAMFITTPRGRNHAKSMFDMAQKYPDEWFAELLTVDDTKALTAAQLESSRVDDVALYGEDIGNAKHEQEYFCNWNAAIMGAFYAREMAKLRAEHRVVAALEHDPDLPVHTAWDLGVLDSTAIWWFQAKGQQLFVLDYYAQHGHTIEHFAPIIYERAKSRGWKRGTDYVPHDARVKEWGANRTRVETMIIDYGLSPQVVPRSSDADGHQAIRLTLPHCIFDDRCENGLSALESYRREWDDDLKTFKAKALHDWASHGAKAFQYLAQAWMASEGVPPPKDKPDFLQVDEMTVPQFIEFSDDGKRDRL